MTKITLIGAGSTSFGAGTLLDIVGYAEQLRGSTIALADLDPVSLEVMTGFGQQLARAAGADLAIEGTTDLRAALEGADFVIVSVARDRLATWKQDWDIPRKHGIKHVL